MNHLVCYTEDRTLMETTHSNNMVNTSLLDRMEVPITKKFPEIVPLETLEYVHPLVKSLFSEKVIPNMPLAGRLKHFSHAWEKITQDREILSIVEGYEIPFLRLPIQDKLPRQAQMSKESESLVEQEILEMLVKGAIQKVQHCPGEFLSNMFLVGKKDGGNRPVINLKQLNELVPYQKFKMEGLHSLKSLLQQGDFLCKIDLKDAYFTVPLNKNSHKFVRFLWSGNLYQFICLCFGLGTAPRIFTKLLKIPIALLRRINIRLVIYLDDMLLMGRTMKDILTARDTLIFLFQHLGFVINKKKSQFVPVKKVEFLGLLIDSESLTISLTQEKMDKVIN